MKRLSIIVVLLLWSVSAWGAGATPVITSKTLFDNYSTLDQLGTGEDGNLRFRGEVIQGGGSPGEDGAAATIAVGTVATGAAGSAATVNNSGTSSAAVFDFSIPRGATGATGAQGPQGAQGPTGPQGVAGGSMAWRGVYDELIEYYANDAVSYGSPASSYIAIATSTGATPDSSPLSWSLVAEAGATGATGPEGPQGPIGFQGYSGAQGPTGPQGETGPQGDTGPAGANGQDGGTLVFRGAWSAFTNYSTLDSVTYNGSSFAAKLPSLNLAPWVPPASPSTPQSDTWQMQAQKGDAGAQGAQGIQGPVDTTTATAFANYSSTDRLTVSAAAATYKTIAGFTTYSTARAADWATLNTAAFTPATDYATAAQGATADTAIQANGFPAYAYTSAEWWAGLAHYDQSPLMLQLYGGSSSSPLTTETPMLRASAQVAATANPTSRGSTWQMQTTLKSSHSKKWSNAAMVMIDQAPGKYDHGNLSLYAHASANRTDSAGSSGGDLWGLHVYGNNNGYRANGIAVEINQGNRNTTANYFDDVPTGAGPNSAGNVQTHLQIGPDGGLAHSTRGISLINMGNLACDTGITLTGYSNVGMHIGSPDTVAYRDYPTNAVPAAKTDIKWLAGTSVTGLDLSGRTFTGPAINLGSTHIISGGIIDGGSF